MRQHKPEPDFEKLFEDVEHKKVQFRKEMDTQRAKQKTRPRKLDEFGTHVNKVVQVFHRKGWKDFYVRDIGNVLLEADATIPTEQLYPPIAKLLDDVFKYRLISNHSGRKYLMPVELPVVQDGVVITPALYKKSNPQPEGDSNVPTESTVAHQEGQQEEEPRSELPNHGSSSNTPAD